jgi:glycosyltransferase involved in cell wall biosynthesis
MGGSKLRIGVAGSSIWVNYFRQAFEDDPDIDVLVIDQSLQNSILQAQNLDALYLIFGWLDYRHFASFISCAIRGIPIVVHWIGTDVWRMANPNEMKRKMRIKRWLLLRSMEANDHCTHLAGAPWLVEELRSCGIEADFCPVICGLLDSHSTPVYPLPDKMAAFSYIPLGREEFYGESLVLSAARSNPDVSFTIVANDQARQPGDLPNVKYYGWVTANEMDEVMKSSTCCIRLTKHDGLAGTLMEAIMRGRYGIFSYSHPHVHKASNSEEINLALADILSKDDPNCKGAEFVRSHYSSEITKESLREFLLSAYCAKG